MNFFSMGLGLVIIFVVIIAAVVVLFGGYAFNLVLPKGIMAVGDVVDIFVDGVYNRSATLTGCTNDRVVIYGSVPLPLDYRGKFYGVGFDENGTEIWYLHTKRHFWLVRLAERVRKLYRLLPYPGQLLPVGDNLQPMDASETAKQEPEPVEEDEPQRPEQ